MNLLNSGLIYKTSPVFHLTKNWYTFIMMWLFKQQLQISVIVRPPVGGD